MQITRALTAGVDKIQIQLRPESLGRIEVRLELTSDGRVATVVTADNRDTLDLLQRDAKSLEQALLDAGLQADLGSMDFNLRGEPDQGEADGDGVSRDHPESAEAEDESLDTAIADSEDGIRADGSVDIRA